MEDIPGVVYVGRHICSCCHGLFSELNYTLTEKGLDKLCDKCWIADINSRDVPPIDDWRIGEP